MHWFESQLAELNKLSDDYLFSQQQPTSDIVNVSESIRVKRSQFINAVQSLVDTVGKIKGISACAAYHEGLILAQSQNMPSIDAFGATVQDSVRSAQQGAAMLGLGNIEQIVIVGAKNKVAMLNVGPLVLCISSSKQINLAAALSQAV